jgi:hypothetical protein
MAKALHLLLLFHPYPLRQKYLQILPPPPYRESISKDLVAKKHVRHAERDILVPVYGYYEF